MKLFESLLTHKQSINGTLTVDRIRSVNLYDNRGWYWYNYNKYTPLYDNSFITLIACDASHLIFKDYLIIHPDSDVEIPHFYGLVQKISNMFGEDGKW